MIGHHVKDTIAGENHEVVPLAGAAGRRCALPFDQLLKVRVVHLRVRSHERGRLRRLWPPLFQIKVTERPANSQLVRCFLPQLNLSLGSERSQFCKIEICTSATTLCKRAP
eukprot:SAG31_NODE_285_length_18479_cov_9.871980_18_plen_111_part_00